MPREKESYRDNLERIKERYPQKEMLTVSEVAAFTGLHRYTVKKIFKFQTFGDNTYISAASLARQMS